MEGQVKRPLVIWITQIGLLLWALTILPALALAIAESWDRGLSFRLPISALFLGILPLGAFMALLKRAELGRELAMLSLICLLAFLFRGLMLEFGPYSGRNISHLGIRSLEMFALIAGPLCLVSVLLVKIGYGSRAAAFFKA